jgi:hypothetical protein
MGTFLAFSDASFRLSLSEPLNIENCCKNIQSTDDGL